MGGEQKIDEIKEFFEKSFENIKGNGTKTQEFYLEAQIKNIEHQRSFLQTILTISISAVGVLLVIYKEFEDKTFYNLAILLFVLTAIFIIIYLHLVISIESNRLETNVKLVNQQTKDGLDIVLDYKINMKDPSEFNDKILEKFAKDELEIRETSKGWFPPYNFVHIIILVFVLGLTSLIIPLAIEKILLLDSLQLFCLQFSQFLHKSSF